MSETAYDHDLLIGACDWRYPRWVGDFYPDDLPEDWRLGYYGNEFPVVLVPADYTLDDDGYAALLEDSGEVLRFVIAIDHAGDAVARLAAARQLGARCVGILLDARHMDAAARDTLLAQCAPLPVSVWGADALPAVGPGAGWCWDGQGEPPPAAALNLARLDVATVSPRRLRAVIEVLLARADESVAVLLLDGDPPSPETLRQAIVIRDLL